MDSKARWFVCALRDACDAALEDGRVGEQTGHIEKIEVTATGSPILMRVTCYGDYSPTEATRVFEDQGVIDVMDKVALYLSSRAIRRLSHTSLEELTCQQNKVL